MTLQRTKFYRVVGVILFVGLLLSGGANQVGATTVNYAQDTTWNAGVGDITIVSGSEVNEVTTTNTEMTISLTSGQKITLRSSDKLNLSTSNYSITCEATFSQLIISATATETVVVIPQSTGCATAGSGSSSGGGGGGGGGAAPASTPTPTPTVSPEVSATPTPAPSTSSGQATPASRGFVNLESVSLNDGDIISAAGSDDPDVYIVNPHGYKRLFLNPVIFGFYGHLGGFQAVKATTSVTRDVFVTSGLFRNCETDDPKVYGVETTGEDTGMLHWVNTTGEQAIADDPDFFKKVFCINSNEFNWYSQGNDYTSVNQVPDYARGLFSSGATALVSTAYKVVSNVGYLNVRASATTASSVLGQLAAGDTVNSLAQDGVWHKIMFEGQEAWVHGNYLEKI